jgi:proline iminopeptidase
MEFHLMIFMRNYTAGNATSMVSMNDTVSPDVLPLPPECSVSGLLDVGEGHRIYYEQCGAAAGIPVIFLHGGPGGGCFPSHRRLFDLTRFRVTLFDQRGCGRSLPRGAVEANTSGALVADIEQLREHLGIDHWLVFGGSWGAGLALAYAAAHRAACLGLVLRGVFLGRASDVDWFFQQARQFLPEAWAALSAQAPDAWRGDLLRWLHDGVHSAEPQAALSHALAWEAWEASVSQRQSAAPRSGPPSTEETAALLAKYRVQSHYLTHGCFWGETALLARIPTLAGLPTAILHGRLDWVCRPQAAWDVHQSLPGSRLQWLEGCGHSPFEPPMLLALGQAMAHFAAHGNFSGWGQNFAAEPEAP